MTKQEQVKQAIEKTGSKSAAARLLGMSRTTLRRYLAGGTPTIRKAAQEAKGKKTLADFRKEYDKDYIVPEKIKQALKDLGPDGWEYESLFSKQAGVSMADLSAYREGFSDFVVVLRRESKRIWAGSKKLAAQLREMI
jgi:transcriptional regulator with XRE-family HTH domain